MKFLVFVLLLASCSKPTSEVVRILESEGCTNIVDGGADIFISGCSDKDTFNNQFVCDKNGKKVRGVLCSGYWKGYTIRYF